MKVYVFHKVRFTWLPGSVPAPFSIFLQGFWDCHAVYC